MDKKTALEIIEFLRERKVSDNSIQHLFWGEDKSLWDSPCEISANDTELVDEIIKLCEV